MNWKFFKTNWFYFALGILCVCYVMRKYPQWNPFQSPDNPKKEKLSNDRSTAKKGAALLGFVPDESDRQKSKHNTAPADAEAFLKRFASVAVSEKKKFGIPVSVILAAAYVNSESGQHEAVSEANNYFALPCSDDWEGETVNVSGECLRQYETAWASFRDFSIFLSSQDWFAKLKKSAGKDWEKWVEKLDDEGISKSGKMSKIIKEFDLMELD
ncbi:MAG TPA: glucosaminidase domain-containing protein [Saprospiraceae bacterium]|nr:glucosaminidase domain-containing protein [Saprospiraceae bacterium]